MLFEVEIPAEPFAAFLACKWLLIIMRVHVECQIIDLMEGFAADVALKWLFSSVCQSVIFIITLLVKTFAANIANKRFVSGVNADVSVQRGRSVESFAANVTFVWLFLRVDNFMSAEGTGLSKTLPAYLTLERPGTRVYRHVTREIVMRVENFSAHLASEGFWGTVATFATNGTNSRTWNRQ